MGGPGRGGRGADSGWGEIAIARARALRLGGRALRCCPASRPTSNGARPWADLARARQAGPGRLPGGRRIGGARRGTKLAPGLVARRGATGMGPWPELRCDSGPAAIRVAARIAKVAHAGGPCLGCIIDPPSRTLIVRFSDRDRGQACQAQSKLTARATFDARVPFFPGDSACARGAVFGGAETEGSRRLMLRLDSDSELSACNLRGLLRTQ
jgi:hypothetical protein